MADMDDIVILPQEIFDNMEQAAQHAEVIWLLEQKEGEREPEENYKTEENPDPEPVLTPTEKALYASLGESFFNGSKEVLALMKREAAFKERMAWRSKKAKAYWDLVRRPVIDIAQSDIMQNIIKFSVMGSLLYFAFRTLWHLAPEGFKAHVYNIVDKWNRNVMEPVGNFFERNYQRISQFVNADFGDGQTIRLKLQQLWENIKGISFDIYGDAKKIFKAAFDSVWRA